MKTIVFTLFMLGVGASVGAQVPYERILDAASEPESWLTYSGTYGAQRYSTLDQVNRDNVDQLQPAWTYQTRSLQKFEVSPLVVDGVMYISEAPSDASALDLRTGRPVWRYRRSLPEGIVTCCGQVNRGVALLDDQVFLGTVDAHLVALDARTGRVRWDVEVADYTLGYSVTVAPLALKDKIMRHLQNSWPTVEQASGFGCKLVTRAQGTGIEAPIHEETQARPGIGRGSGKSCRLLRVGSWVDRGHHVTDGYVTRRMSWSAVSASTPNMQWHITFAGPRTRTWRPPNSSLRRPLTRSTAVRSL